MVMTTKKSRAGRPKGKNKTSRLEVMVSPEIKDKFVSLTRDNGSNPSVKINEMIISYIKESEKGDG